MLNRTEILAPAGNYDAVRAAVNAHADAIYLGGSMFSARAFAGNFDEKELLDTIDYCHTFDVKVYMAINTLLKNEEIKRLPEYVKPFYREGVDGIIVQDMGVAGVLSACFPDLPLHGSTQLSVSSEYGAAFLKKIGMTRFVPSRELSLDEIRAIKDKVNIEIETFVHGAMCYSYSGRCLMSSYAGGRSGNRGRCAQPCRKKYRLGDESAYMLSLKDMCMLQDIDKLMDAGIDSFKIEGRMKKPEYVAATTYAYKEIRDAYLSGCKDLKKMASRYEDMLRDVYNRGGFYSGYYFTAHGRQMLADIRPNHTGVKIGKVSSIEKPFVKVKLCNDVNAADVLEIRGRKGVVELTCGEAAAAHSTIFLKGKNFQSFSIGDQIYRTRNSKLLNDIQKEIIDSDRKIAVKAFLTARIGERIKLSVSTYDTASTKTVNVCVYGPECMAASNKPVTQEQLIEKIKKTGGTSFEISEIEADVEDGLFVQISAINGLRRQALDELGRSLADRHKRNIKSVICCEDNYDESGFKNQSDMSGFSISVCQEDHVNIVKNYKWVSRVILDYNIRQYRQTMLNKNTSVFIALPEIFRQKNLVEYADMLSDISDFDGVMIRNIDELGYLIEIGYKGDVVADAGLYVYNDHAAAFYKNQIHNISFVSSAELTYNEIKNLSTNTLLKIYGYQKVMVSANCISGNYCGGCAQKSSQMMNLTDDMGNVFYVRNYCGECYNIMYNGVPTSILDRLDLIHDSFTDAYIELTVEDGEKTNKIMDYIEKNIIGLDDMEHDNDIHAPIKEYTRGHYFKGIE